MIDMISPFIPGEIYYDCNEWMDGAEEEHKEILNMMRSLDTYDTKGWSCETTVTYPIHPRCTIPDIFEVGKKYEYLWFDETEGEEWTYVVMEYTSGAFHWCVKTFSDSLSLS